ncbi:MAG: hypothetical protein B7Y99_07050 [Caulobacterales bacterium 32-69-10]|nr:MAG: hypothetical protein B7Y99_07050 [Caulobacterales bacterium 32-69-10]
MNPITTTGYEKEPQGQVIERLRNAGVELVIDVRAVAASRRAGFSKTLLSGSLKEAGIGYLHLRDLGTPKAGRQAARAGRIEEMKAIFEEQLATAAAIGALELAIEQSLGRKACLLCYEADPACCHRTVVAERISARTGAKIVHL